MDLLILGSLQGEGPSGGMRCFSEMVPKNAELEGFVDGFCFWYVFNHQKCLGICFVYYSLSFQVFQKRTYIVKIPSEPSKMHFFLAGCGNVMCFMFILWRIYLSNWVKSTILSSRFWSILRVVTAQMCHDQVQLFDHVWGGGLIPMIGVSIPMIVISY